MNKRASQSFHWTFKSAAKIRTFFKLAKKIIKIMFFSIFLTTFTYDCEKNSIFVFSTECGQIA